MFGPTDPTFTFTAALWGIAILLLITAFFVACWKRSPFNLVVVAAAIIALALLAEFLPPMEGSGVVTYLLSSAQARQTMIDQAAERKRYRADLDWSWTLTRRYTIDCPDPAKWAALDKSGRARWMAFHLKNNRKPSPIGEACFE